MKDYWSTLEQFCMLFYNNMYHNQFLHVLRYVHLCNNVRQSDKTDKNSDRLRKIRSQFGVLSDTCAKFYSPFQHLAVDEVKGRDVHKQYFPRNKSFGTNIYKLCNMNPCTLV
jgi:hypothetical protein